MEFHKVIVFLFFMKVDIDSITLNNTTQIAYTDLKRHIIDVCSEFFKRSFCVLSSIEYRDLQTFILRECYFYIPVLQFSSEEKVASECQKVLIIEEGTVSVCRLILYNSLAKIMSIVVLTNKTISEFLNESKECTTYFDSMNIVIISLQNREMRLVNTTVSSMHYLVQNGEIKRNRKLAIIPNFQGKLIKVATFNYPPFSVLRNEGGTAEYFGIEMSLFYKLAAYLNFTWELVPLKSPGRFGIMLDNGTMMGGVNQALREGVADIGFCNLWQRELYSSNMDYGPALNMIYVTFIVRRPHQLVDQWQSLFMIFTVHVWLTIATSFSVITLVYWRACQIVPLVSRKPSLIESSVMMFGILTVSSSFTVPVSLTSRLVTMWSFLFALLLMTTVTSCIVTRLTLPLYSPRVDTVRQLVEHDYLWTDPSYYSSNKTNKDFLFDLKNEWHRIFESRYEYVPPDELLSHILTERNIALPVQRWGQEHVLLNIEGINLTTDLRSFIVMRGYTQIAFTSFGYRRYSGYNEAFNRIIQQFIEFGLWEYQKHKLTFLPTNRKYLLEEQDHDFSSLQRLSVNNLYPAFMLLVIGQSVALTVLLLELTYNYCCKKNE